ncbi:lactonase family protein [Fimbriiglobus ruber]|uniref:Putative hemagglutinin-related protein n=1 Tax=Fimbriiglobus ruber TaxID=1908690 RepID=A0A225ECF7_9BACT|nr:beta-propeller fold lactonase family protein [Fimbriiglobus ruber]OWK47019.1 putative hemagglutinin-related protein [Fimbriiglobus ruber]
MNSTLRTRSRLGVENLEDRAVPASLSPGSLLNGVQLAPPAGVGATVANVYVETNNPATGQNAVLGFHRQSDGSLTQFGTYATGGTGQLNVPKVVGPDDGDQEVVATPDGRFVFAVNEGSGSVTGFKIGQNGALTRVGTFDTGGVQPDSIGIAGDRLYVANRGDASATHPGTVAPSIVGFDIGTGGDLTPVPNSTVTFPVGTFVTQTLISRDGRFLFAEVASLAGAPQGNTLAPFQILQNGDLQLAPGGDVAAGTNASLILGAAANPNLNIVYSGITAGGRVGVFTYDETGRTSFVGASADQGHAPCWCTVSADGRVLYVANTATDSIGVYSLANPLNPVQIQEFSLGGPHLPVGGTGNTQSQAFQISLDPTGKSLYVISQSDNTAFQQGNQLHTLAVARDGTLTEPNAPIIFAPSDVPANAHPQGIAVVPVTVPPKTGRPGGDRNTGSGRGQSGVSSPFQNNRGNGNQGNDSGYRVGAGISAFDFGDESGSHFREW